MVPGTQRCDAMKGQPGFTAPDHYIAVLQQDRLQRITSRQPAEAKPRRQSQRYRYDGRCEVLLITVLMQTHTGAYGIAIDEAGIWLKTRKVSG